MPNYEILAAQDVPHYGTFEVEAESLDAALAAATVRLRSGEAEFNEPEWEGAHSLRIVSMRRDGEDPTIHDVNLDPDAPLWPCREITTALRESTTQLAFLLGSLGDEGEYPPELDQIEANLRLLGTNDALALADLRGQASAPRWVHAVECWGYSSAKADAAAKEGRAG